MCGIVGIFHHDAARAVDAELLSRMNESLQHRGPDDRGLFCEGPIGLAMRRLSIVDVAEGRQPALNEDGRVRVVFNGEIYNHPELQDGLRGAGHRLHSRSDTECLPHLYEEHDLEFVSRLCGMFAIALWDQREHRLVLARDRLGKKPLYVMRTVDETVFASELKALMVHPACGRTVDIEALARYFVLGYVSEPYAILKGVAKLPPGHLAIATPRRYETRRYWDCPFAQPLRGEVTMAAEVEALRPLVADAVRIRLRSDVPLGAFLSGGVDSSLVVAEMAAAGTKERVHTYCVGFEEQAYDESPWAAQVAQRLGTKHEARILKMDDFEGLLTEVSEFMDEPLADTSVLPTFQLSRHARGGITVALSGDGGDEVFGGYHSFSIVRDLMAWRDRARWWRTWSPRIFRPLPRRWRRRLLHERLRGFAQVAGRPDVLWGHELLQVFAPETAERLRPGDLAFRQALSGIADEVRETLAHGAAEDPIHRLQHYYLHYYLPGDVLAKVDRASMATSLEVRSPLLDHRLLERTASLPSSLKIDARGRRKPLLLELAAGHLPRHLLDRPKRGFSLPLGPWLGRGLLREARERLSGSGLFDPDQAESLGYVGDGGRWRETFALLALAAWERRYLR